MLLKYVITDGSGNYMMKNVVGQYVPISSVNDCDKYDSRTKASNVLRSCINRNLRNRYTVEEIEIEEPQETEQPEIVISDNEEYPLRYRPRQDEMKNLINQDSTEVDIDALRSNIKDTIHTMEEIRQRKDKLKKQHSQVEKEICDIEHYIELSDGMNAYQGWLAYMMLKKKLQSRRKLKDEIMVLSNIDDIMHGLKTTVSQIDGLKTRKYEPRVLNELFT